ncbi:hypothetical protein AVEN_223396-1 [Araneus ventricosus]|uniref:Uncharacterized protein n=1 Tax=Araneus ventricosus TaxID=182803 RepID=A0A4Y2KKG3_ARAVE|nr:hypothetical protein AVEN_223396-1 [Araneus ventricosus]
MFSRMKSEVERTKQNILMGMNSKKEGWFFGWMIHPLETEKTCCCHREDYAREVMPPSEGDDDQGSEQVVGYLDEENATIVLQSQGELNWMGKL